MFARSLHVFPRSLALVTSVSGSLQLQYGTVKCSYIDQSLRYQNDLAFSFLLLKNSLKIMKTSFVFVNQEIRKQKLHKKCNCVNKSHAFLDFQICACAQ